MDYNQVIQPLESGKVIKATKYISPTQTLKATRRRFGGKITGELEVVLNLGKPNYLEREFIKACKKAGEPFPVKKVQLKYLNPSKKPLKPTHSPTK